MSLAPTATTPIHRHTGGGRVISRFDSRSWAHAAAAKAPSGELPFVYHGWQFSLRAEDDGLGGFKPVVFWNMHGKERMALPARQDRFDTDNAAFTCAEEQAVRWVREHMGYGAHDF